MIPYISEMSASKINKNRKGKNCSCLDVGMSKKLQVKGPARQVPGSGNGEGDWLWKKGTHCQGIVQQGKGDTVCTGGGCR